MLTAYQIGFLFGSMPSITKETFMELHKVTECLTGYFDAKFVVNNNALDLHLDGP